MESISRYLKRLIREIVAPGRDPFDRDARGLSPARATAIVELAHGDDYNLRAAPVAKQLGGKMVKMLAYNCSIPGPTLRVPQGAELVVHFTNLTEVEATVHWHGLRLDNRFDGVPQGMRGGMQPPIPTGGSYTYQLRFPDPGLFWYHPHIREDYTQELGLYGNILVVPADPHYWSPVNREITLVVDDILIENGQVAPFDQSGPTQTAMGRFGNVMLVNGETEFNLPAQRGEVVRFYLTNTANARNFNLSIPGAKMKLVGGDNGRVEQEEFVESLLLAPSERAVVDVLFEQAGQFPIEHRTPGKTYSLGTVAVAAEPAATSFAVAFSSLRHSQELIDLRAEIAGDFDREPDKTIALIGEMPSSMKDDGGAMHVEGTEMALHHPMSHPGNMIWKIVDQATGKANHDIDWVLESGPRVKIRIENSSDSAHPMPHPIHFHGERFLVLRRDGQLSDNLVWKDTVLVKTGEAVDILLDTSNPGIWMAHCHIAEHLEGGMMFSFRVKGEAMKTP